MTYCRQVPPRISQRATLDHQALSPEELAQSLRRSLCTQSQDIVSSSVLRGRSQQQSFVGGPSGTTLSSPNTSLLEQPNQLEKRLRSLSTVTRSKPSQSPRKYRQSK